MFQQLNIQKYKVSECLPLSLWPCLRCKWREIMQKNHRPVACPKQLCGLEEEKYGGFVRQVLLKHLYFHYSILFVWGGLLCWANKNSKFLIQSIGQKPAEKCVPLQIILTQWEHPVREAIQSAMLRLSFISYWAKRSVDSLTCSGWILWLNISYWILVCAFKPFCLFPSLLRYFSWLMRGSCCAGVLRAGTSRDSFDFFCWHFTMKYLIQNSCFSFWLLYPPLCLLIWAESCISSCISFPALI